MIILAPAFRLALICALSLPFFSIPRVEAEDLANLFTEGKADLVLRYRIEVVDQEGIAENALASTLQTLLGYKTGEFHGISGYVQFRNVSTIGGESYNNTINGKSQYPVVADPAATELDQAYIKFAPDKNAAFTVGRRKLKWGNQRFISALGWRQNNRSFDSVVLEGWSSDKKIQAKYAYAWNVNRAFTDKSPVGNFDSDIHLFNLSYGGLKFGELTGYGYLVDLHNAFALGLSTSTFGVNFTGKQTVSPSAKFLYIVEYANQKSYKSNPKTYSVDYFRTEGGVAFDAGVTVKIGYEELGSDGSNSFQTPLALLHAFNGWADKFLVTPGAGLTDKYANLVLVNKSGPTLIKGIKLILFYHQFDSKVGDQDYGSEWDAAIIQNFAKHYNVILKIARYRAESFATDTTKFWFALSAKF